MKMNLPALGCRTEFTNNKKETVIVDNIIFFVEECQDCSGNDQEAHERIGKK